MSISSWRSRSTASCSASPGGIVVDGETLAGDVIRRVGHGGTYLADDHTRRHAGELFRPTVWDRSPYDTWLAAGRPGARDKAAEIAAGILAEHQPEPLADDLAAELSAVVARADALLVVTGRNGRGLRRTRAARTSAAACRRGAV